MRRFASVAVVGAVIVAACSSGTGGPGAGCGAGTTVSATGPEPSMACVAPEPAMTPWPVSGADAIAAARAMGGRSDYALYSRERNAPVWLLRASDQLAVVNGLTARVEAFYPLAIELEQGDGNAWPDWSPTATAGTRPDPPVTEARARALAVDFLAERGLATTEGGHVDLDPAPGPPAWRAVVPGSGEDDLFEVRVDATTGAVTAFVRSTHDLYIDLPRIDRDTAIRLAMGYAGLLSARSDLHPTAAYPMVTFGQDRTQRVTWQVTVDAPATDAGTSPLLAGVSFEVDAVTGGIRVDK